MTYGSNYTKGKSMTEHVPLDIGSTVMFGEGEYTLEAMQPSGIYHDQSLDGPTKQRVMLNVTLVRSVTPTDGGRWPAPKEKHVPEMEHVMIKEAGDAATQEG